MKKGNFVELDPETCFTKDNGGGLQFPLTHYLNDERGVVEGYRHTTQKEIQDWEDSPESKGMNCAGESKLPPLFAIEEVQKGEIMLIERARCRMSFGYGNPTGGWAKVKKINSDTIFYVKRHLLKVIAT